MFQRIPTIAATVLLVLAAPSAIAAEPAAVQEQVVRIQPTIVPLLQTTEAKRADAGPAKPEAAPRIPGPVVSMHYHRNADGSLSIACNEEHAEDAR